MWRDNKTYYLLLNPMLTTVREAFPKGRRS
jgi:hypothetical protein